MKNAFPYVILNGMRGAINLNIPTIHRGFIKMICLYLLRYLFFNPGNSCIMFGKGFRVNLIRMH